MTAPTTRRVDESMTLITAMLERPQDPAYAAAAARRERAGLHGATPVGTPVVVVTAMLIGLLLALASTTLRTDQVAGAKVRADLIAQIDARRTLVDERSGAIQERARDIATLERAALSRAQLSGLSGEIDKLRLTTGIEAVRGPGITVTLDDAATAASGSDGTTGTVLSRDVFIVTNALWEAGAEAIAINGQRLTARSPIRFAGSAIIVNYRPLVPPYRIVAIGDPDTLLARFGAGLGAAYVKSLTNNYGIRSDISTQGDVTLPGAPVPATERAHRPTEGSS
ncbi:MAG: DUF881 domain-containing protein [Dermatophilaceae bacterium]